MKKISKLLIVANLILVPTAAAIPDVYAKVLLAIASGCNAGAAYLIREE